MTPLQMAEAAAIALATPGTLGLTLTIPKGKTPKGFPRGELLNEVKRDGVIERTSSYSPEKILAWLVRNKLVSIKKEGLTITIEEIIKEDAS